MSKYDVSSEGFYGRFGGAYIPEMLYPNVENLKKIYLEILNSEKFKSQYKQLMKDYVGRPTPLFYAEKLSSIYSTHVFLKREDLAHTGAHKINNAIGQVLIAKEMGKTRIIAETGAGQHGVATATACALLGMECHVYMGEVDIERQAPNVARMRMLGAEVVPAKSGNKTLKDATNEALRDWISNPEDTFYVIGSTVGPFPYPDLVARLQSIISEEMRWQLKEQTGKELPDYVIACIGGGSNAAGSFYHFVNDEQVKLVAVEAAGHGLDSGDTAASIARGSEGIIHGARTMLMQTDDGQITEPYSISAGLDYPGIGPMHSFLAEVGRETVLSATDDEALQAALQLTREEGIIPALESSHALAALPKLKFRSDENVVVTISGRGDKDMATYINHLKL
ncbi:MAG: tryptophan synthase subunit beta [Paludibacteraceae bacterium]|nr:tryptophan synthase subunit beta [Paludibacteraceae bacterium]MBR5373239.1 tryptophan synthase subunit beta [Paludibacteraceae bacterium]